MISSWYQNGTRTDTVAINDRGLQYGDGLFETIALRNGTLRLWELHAGRLRRGCDTLGIALPSASDLLRQIMAVVDMTKGSEGDALLKIIVTRGDGRRGYAAPVDTPPTVLIGIFGRTRFPDHYYQKGIEICICHARLSAQPQTAGIKLLSRLDQVRASSEWHDPDIAEGLMMDYDDRVVCGTRSNLFIVRKGSLFTPELTQCGVSGVMRRHILAIAAENGIRGTVTTLPRESIATADEIFLCNSQFGIWPVARCGDKVVSAWPLTRQLMGLVRDSGVIEGPA